MVEALFITVVGMGGVFSFLLLLIWAMIGLRIFSETRKSDTENLDKVALAVAVMQRGK